MDERGVIADRLWMFLSRLLLLSTFLFSALLPAIKAEAAFCEAVYARLGASGDEITQSFWQKLEDEYATATSKAMAQQSALMQHAKEIGDEHYKRLVELGFDYAGNKAPSLRKIHHAYMKQMEKHVSEGKIQESDMLVPALAFFRKNGSETDWKFLVPGEKIPEGFKQHTDSYLPGKIYYKMISDGYFPMGQSEIVDWAKETVLEHDLAHITAFMDYPEMMAAFKKSIVEVVSPANENNVANLSKINARFYHVSELAAIVAPESRSEFKSIFKISPPEGKDFLTLEEVKEALKGKSKEELAALTKDAKDFYWRWTRQLAGTSRDINMRSQESSLGQASIHALYKDLAGVSSMSFQSISNFFASDTDKLARLLASLYNFSHLKSTDWVKSVSEPDAFSQTALYRALCLSGVWTSGSRMHNEFCTGL